MWRRRRRRIHVACVCITHDSFASMLYVEEEEEEDTCGVCTHNP
jgi:hypothetical protein